MDQPGLEEAGLSARRLYCPQLPAPGQECALDAEAAQHARVLRLAPGDSVELFDGRGGKLRAKLLETGKRMLRCVASGPIEQVARGPRLVLVQCQPKGAKLDDIVRMTTEIGVSAIHVALSERCVARTDGERADHKAERLRRVACEAVRQSEQAYLPEILAPAPLAEVLRRAPTGATRLALIERSGAPLPGHTPGDELWLAVGPEGGFSDADRRELAQAGFVPAALGRSILRTETAAVVGVTLGLERLGRGR